MVDSSFVLHCCAKCPRYRTCLIETQRAELRKTKHFDRLFHEVIPADRRPFDYLPLEERLIVILKMAQWTQEEMAQITNITQGRISQVLSRIKVISKG